MNERLDLVSNGQESSASFTLQSFAQAMLVPS